MIQLKKIAKMLLFSYVIARDYGFAPNPFSGYCTLATCKASIRHQAQIGDWVIGTGPIKKLNIPGRLVYAMRVTEKSTFNQYWDDPRFQVKKPHMNGGLKQAFGDNIYYKNVKWRQENSHHSLPGGKVNMHNLVRDTKYPDVLISNHFYYFGKNHIAIPSRFADLCLRRQGYKKNHDDKLVNAFLNWLENKFSPGLLGNPIQFETFARYDGLS